MMTSLVLCVLINALFVQVSSVTDHIGAQESVAKSNDLDDDEGGGLVGV